MSSVRSVPESSGLCAHCELPVPAARRRRGNGFCCNGCETVHQLILDSGLEAFYAIRQGSGIPPDLPRDDGFPWLRDLTANTVPGEPVRLTLEIQGLHCAACIWILNALFRRYPAGLRLDINPATSRAEILWDPARGDLAEWLRAAQGFGYRFGPAAGTATGGSRDLLVRMGLSIALAMNVMVFSLAYYFGLEPTDAPLYNLFGWLSAGLTTIAVAAGGWVFFRGALRGLRHRLVHLDLPIAIGIALAYGGSLAAFLARGPEAAYFDTVAVFVALMLVGRWLQERILLRNRRTVLSDPGIEQLYTRRFKDGRLTEIPAGRIEPGDILWIAPGDVIPVSGDLLEERAELSLAWINGESQTVNRDATAPLPAGALNAGTGAIRMRARETVAASRLGDLLAPAAPLREAPGGGRLWRRFSLIYFLGVSALATVGFAIGAATDWVHGFEIAVAVLVVTCPCAVGLATPLAHELALLRLRRRGIFVRTPGFLDRARGITRIVFDKTGTLTLGSPALTAGARAELDALGEAERRTLGNMVARSNHPASRALAEELAGASRSAEPHTLEVEPELAVEEIAGQGLLCRNGSVYRLGHPAFALEGAAAKATTTAATTTGPVFTRNGVPLAAFALDESLKADAREEIDTLRQAGLDIHILSGDTDARVRAAARSLGIPEDRATGGMSPEDKQAWLAEHDRGDTLMIGDGLNDGPSLGAATCSGTPAIDHPSIPGRSDFYFLGEGIGAVSRTLATARTLGRVIRRNLIFAVTYNLAAVAGCYLGWITPVVAAVLMPLSSVTLVVWTSLTLRPGRTA